MEFEVVQVKVPKGFLCGGNCLMICNSEGGDKVHGPVRGSDGKPWLLVSRPEQLKPEWRKPRIKKGWLTWDYLGGWYWWADMPEYGEENGWMYPENGCDFCNEEIGEVMAEFLGCPDCSGFNERHCIWEVGE